MYNIPRGTFTEYDVRFETAYNSGVLTYKTIAEAYAAAEAIRIVTENLQSAVVMEVTINSSVVSAEVINPKP